MKAIENFFVTVPKEKAFLMSPVSLAFVGDACYSLYVRSDLVANLGGNAKAINTEANSFVNAVAQSMLFDIVAPLLSGDEADIARRARNAHTSNIAKNASIEQYKKATSLEAVLGYLYLSGSYPRIAELLSHDKEIAKRKVSI